MKVSKILALSFLIACSFGCGGAHSRRSGVTMSQYQIRTDLDYMNQELKKIGQDSMRDTERAYLQGLQTELWKECAKTACR